MSLAAVPDADLPLDFARDVLDGLARLHQTVLVLDAQGVVVWRKDSAGLLAKCPPSATPRSVAHRILEPTRYEELCGRLSTDGLIVNERVRIPLGGGRTFPVEVSLTRLGGMADGSHVVALLRPIEDREQHDRQLRHTIEYLGAILDAAPEAVVALDRGGYVTYANPAIERLLGFPAEEIVDKPVSAYVRSPGDLVRFATLLRPGAETFSEDIELRRKDEAVVRVRVSGSSLVLPEGMHAGQVLVLHDVTERRRVEAELSRKNAELEHYVHAVSHDLRSPLVALLGFTRLLQQDYGDRLDDKARHFLDRIEQAGRTMETLANDLLELSRIGSRSERRALVDPLRVLSIVQSELKPRLEEYGVKLVLPPSSPLVLCDRTRLYQVFSNLLGNAVDHMGEVPSPRITVSIEETPTAHVISVADNGRGVDPAHHERIFEIFQSLGPRRDGRRGTGVGLAIVRKIAETHGGRVWVESAPGDGTAFRLLLPRA
ncbi:MAG: PAS domain-containing protein [Deltaproteobacteria bacterium]|nr:PAS domain-containing protein [Deltaproteobacteria bacterium]